MAIDKLAGTPYRSLRVPDGASLLERLFLFAICSNALTMEPLFAIEIPALLLSLFYQEDKTFKFSIFSSKIEHFRIIPRN